MSKKNYLYEFKAISKYGVKSIWRCLDRGKLEAEAEKKKAEGYKVTEITLGGWYNIDGNTGLDVTVCNK